jgi:hypothetical protein
MIDSQKMLKRIKKEINTPKIYLIPCTSKSTRKIAKSFGNLDFLEISKYKFWKSGQICLNQKIQAKVLL